MEQRALGNLLVRHRVVSPEVLENLLAQQREKGTPLGELVVQTRSATDEQVARALAEECALQFVNTVNPALVPLQHAMRLPIGYARSHRLLVVDVSDTAVEVVCADPLDAQALDDVRAVFELPVVARVATSEVVVDAINRVYERQETQSELETTDEQKNDDEIDILDSDDDAPIIRWVNSLFSQSVKERASDIHIEPEEKEVVVRYRIDGELYVARRASRQFMGSVVARVKIMAGLNIAEKRLPQDGRISLRIAGRAIDIRVSTIPTSRDHERIVMRLLHKTNTLLDLSELGFSPRDYQVMDRLINRPDGIILVTGPTGSGKTTTLYACLNKINDPSRNILTAEDPVEYEISGIHQVPVQPKIGLTFASALRAFLRQDPDVVMVGEIRDKETAEIAMQASMTGHLVLSTVHTNDAAGAIARLTDMGVEPFLVRSNVCGILAQRLVRMLCPACKEPYEATQQELEQLGIDRESSRRKLERKISRSYSVYGVEHQLVAWHEAGAPTFYKPKGCDQCGGKGFIGRRGIYELLVIDDGIAPLILKSADSQSIKRRAQQDGMETLRDDGARKVLKGLTTVEEVLAAKQEEDTVD